MTEEEKKVEFEYRKGWLCKLSFSDEFVKFLVEMYNKYGESVFAIQGISNKYMDIANFSKNFFTKSNVADISADGNANVKEKNIVQYNYENNKSMMKLNNLYRLYKAIKKTYSTKEAEQCLEKLIGGELFINDLSNFAPYSYYGNTPIIVKIDEKIEYLKLKTLYELFESFAEDKKCHKEINTNNINQIMDVGILYNKETDTVSRAFPKSAILKEFPTKKLNIKVWDTVNGWVNVSRIIKHKSDKDFILYQTNNGDFALVTEDHPIYMENGTEKNAGDLIIGDSILKENNLPEVIKNINVPEKLAYLMGFIIGDGNLNGIKPNNSNLLKTGVYYAKGRYGVAIYQNDIDNSYIKKIVEDCFSNLNLYKVSEKSERAMFFSSFDLNYICSNYFGMYDKENSFTKHLPKNILEWDDDSVLALLSGLIDSDGTINKESKGVNIRLQAIASINMLRDRLSNMSDFYKISARIDGADIKNCIYEISFRVKGTSKLIQLSQKLKKEYENDPLKFDEYNDKMDTKIHNNGISKIIRFSRDDINKTRFFYNELENVYDITTETGRFYANGMVQHNCYAFDLRELVHSGMPYIEGGLKITAPKYSESFIDLIIQSTAYISNQIAGACSYPDFFVCLNKFYEKEYGSDYIKMFSEEKNIFNFYKKNDLKVKKIRQQFQKIIYSLNFQFRNGQSAFSNLSVLDKGFLNSLFAGYEFYDGIKPNLDNSYELSKLFFEYFADINCKEGIFTFPVMTLACSVDENNDFIDKEFVKWVAKVNCEKSLGNVFIDVPTSFSSCCRLKNDFSKVADSGFQNSFGVGGLAIGCYDKETEILTDNGWMFFKDLIEYNKSNVKKLKVLSAKKDTGEAYYVEPTDYFESKYNGIMHHYINTQMDILVTPNHNMLVKERKSKKLNLIQSQDMTPSKSIPRLLGASNKPDLEMIKLENKEYDANLFCKLLGLYLGDGGTYHDREEAKKRGYEISFCGITKDRGKEHITDTLEKLGYKYNINEVNRSNGSSSLSIKFYDKTFYEFVQPLGKCLEKHIPNDFLQSLGTNNLKFLLEGLINTDGSNSEKQGMWYYTSSKKLADNVTEIAILLGYPTRLYKRIREPSYIKRDDRYITSKNMQYEVKFLLKDKVFSRIVKYRKEEEYDDMVYCVEVPEHILFTRRNGRTAWCGNSHRVAGLNLPRIALLEKDNEDILDEDLECLRRILYAHREIIEKQIKDGYLPLYTHNWIHLNKQYSTIGFIGAAEYVKNKNENILEEGVDTIKNILTKIDNKISKWQKDYSLKGKHIRYNIEQIPGESVAVRLASIDNLLGYNKDFNLYSNQYISLTEDAAIYDRIVLQGKIDQHTSGGAILHINVDDEKPLDEKQYLKLIETARENKCKYFAVNYCYSEDEHGNFIIGKHEVSPIDGSKIVNIYTRVVGFITPVAAWNKVRRLYEFPNRHFYKNENMEINNAA